MSASVLLIPLTAAHTPSWQIPTFAYINVAPDPVGVGQEVLVVFWLDKTFDGTARSDIQHAQVCGISAEPITNAGLTG